MKGLGQMFVGFGLVGNTSKQQSWQLKKLENEVVTSFDVGCTIQIEHLPQFG